MGGAFDVEYRRAALAGCANVLKVLFAATRGSCALKHPLTIILVTIIRFVVDVLWSSLLKF